jgi:glycosyltransferase involved in cell wall biosynthesis
MLAARSLGKPYVVKIVGDYAWEQGNQRFGVTVSLDEFVKLKKVPFFVGVLQKIQRKVAHHAVRVIVPSRYLKGVIQTWGIPEEKIEVIYNAVPNEKIGTVPDSVAQLPRPLVVSIGRLVPWKHMGRVIDAVAHAGGKGVLPSLAIVGGGPLRVSLMRIGREKLGSRCVLTGILSHRDTLSVSKQADVFVLNSSYEGLSHLLIEALTFGVPIITTRVGGNPEVINHDENGLLIEVGDTSGLESAIVRVLSDDALRARLSLRAKESAGRFTMETMIAETTAVLAKFQ